MEIKRVTLFAGHYGSGKTNLAVNYAKYVHAQGKPCVIADLDIVNPYFRTKDSEKELAELGISLICSAYANTNLDAPALPAQMYDVVNDRETYAIMDIGGDDRGAYALGRYTPAILEENDYEMLFVANFYRPLTQTVDDIIEVMREIEAAGGIPFTAIVHNSNLGKETTIEDVMAKERLLQELAQKTGLPVKMTGAMESIAPALAKQIPNVFSLQLQKR
jgi:MinD-like ATPase involved in chromosome partitioning or flagellar assembly